MLRTSDKLQIGKAGEYLVCADLIVKGFVAYPSEQGLPYDVVLDNGKKLLKVQVKTTSKPRVVPQRKKETKGYVFDIKRTGNGNSKEMKDGDADLLALVCLDTRNVGYLDKSSIRQMVTYRVDALRGTYYDESGVQDYERAKELHKTISNISEIARIMNKNVGYIHKMLQENYKPYLTNAKYFSDIIRNREWFLDL